MTRRSEVTGPLRVNSELYSERPPGFVLRQHRKDSVLHCDDVPLTKLAERYGTPSLRLFGDHDSRAAGSF